jgi:hypothetical protein
MDQVEQIEKIRQAIMRYRELLDLMNMSLAKGEAAYQALFPADLPDNMPEKDRQWIAAEKLLADTSRLQRIALHLRLTCRDFEREFEQVHDNLIVE